MSVLKIYANKVSGNCWKVKWTADQWPSACFAMRTYSSTG
jgi:hypothetical protein